MAGVNLKGSKPTKPKLNKQERREKYTKLHRDRTHQKRQREKFSSVTCFHCRKRGHALADCPEAGQSKQIKICFKCGSVEHSLALCPKRRAGNGNDTDLPFASCFVCQKKGHLSSQCPENEKGLYVNGGACKNCGSTRHLSKECTEKKGEKAKRLDNYDDGDIDDLLESPPDTNVGDKKTENEIKKKRVVKF